MRSARPSGKRLKVCCRDKCVAYLLSSPSNICLQLFALTQAGSALFPAYPVTCTDDSRHKQQYQTACTGKVLNTDQRPTDSSMVHAWWTPMVDARALPTLGMTVVGLANCAMNAGYRLGPVDGGAPTAH